MDYYKGGNVIEIVERSDGYIDGALNGLKVYFSDYKNWYYAEKKVVFLT